MSKNDDVIVQSSLDVATQVAQLMSATSAAPSCMSSKLTSTIRSMEPWDDMQAIAEFAVYKAYACSRV